MLVFPLLIQHKCFKLLCIYNYKTVSTGIKADTMFTVMYRMTQQNPNFIRSVLFLFYILNQNAIELWAKNKLTVIFCWHLHTRRFIFSCSCSSSFSSTRDGSPQLIISHHLTLSQASSFVNTAFYDSGVNKWIWTVWTTTLQWLSRGLLVIVS